MKIRDKKNHSNPVRENDDGEHSLIYHGLIFVSYENRFESDQQRIIVSVTYFRDHSLLTRKKYLKLNDVLLFCVLYLSSVSVKRLNLESKCFVHNQVIHVITIILFFGVMILTDLCC